MIEHPREAARAKLRQAHRVRLVTNAEEGSAAADVPPGVFGFTSSPGLAAPLFPTRHTRNFEVHHLHNGDVAVVGFVRPSERAQLDGAHQPVELTIYPDAEGEATEVVAIPYTRIVHHRQYSVRNAAGLTLQVAPAVEVAGT